MQKITDLRQLIDLVLPKNPQGIAFMIREGEGVRSIRNSEFVDDVRALAASLMRYDTTKIAVTGENSYKWVVCYMAAIYRGFVVVPIDKDLSNEEIKTIITTSETGILLFGDSHEDIIAPILEQFPQIESYNFYRDTSKTIQRGSVEELIEQGREILKSSPAIFDSIKVNPNEMCTIVFTSGTTGTGKGVMISHHNILSDLDSSKEVLFIGPVQMAILPMHHTFQSNLGIILCLYSGSTMAINNSIKFFAQNLKLYAPTDLLCVPLVLETMYANMWSTIKESGKEPLVRAMVRFSNFLMKIGIDVRRKLFKKIIDGTGGKLIDIFCGGALLDADVARGMISFGFNVHIGYGITECSPLIAGNVSFVPSKMGSCGFPFSCNELKLVDVDENGDGEIWVKGSNVMLGYYKNEEATREVMQDGWFKTGDIGRYDKDGYLYITGRKKNVIVLTNGKNIYPEELETLILKSPLVKESAVYSVRGEKGEEGTIAAEIFPDFDYAQKNSIENVEEQVNDLINNINLNLPYYKRIVAVKFRENEFEKTTTKKIKRHKL